MTTEWGALAGVFPVDDVTLKWIGDRISFIRKRGLAGIPSDVDNKGYHSRLNSDRLAALSREIQTLKADQDAVYKKDLVLDLTTVQPHVSGPNSVKVMTGVVQLKEKKVKINKAYLVSCVNSRVEDLAEAAEIVRGKKVANGVEFYIAAASSEVEDESRKRGDWQALLDSGAIPLPPGCGPCIGLGVGLLKDGEVGISATNRNFKGRMGSREAFAYLASPAVVAASALTGTIDYPGEWKAKTLAGTIRENRIKSSETGEVKLMKGFPAEIPGELIFCYQDNINTDGIYPGKYTYLDDFTPEQQAEVVMENYDPEFKEFVKEGDILVGGFNFGTGSSREQAATALKYRGISLVLAGSLNETYKRNALNNGFMVIEVPDLVIDLKDKFGSGKLSVRTGITAKIDFRKCLIHTAEKTYKFSPIGAAAQELIVADGLENWVKQQ
jgi:homoaconitate hydratase